MRERQQETTRVGKPRGPTHTKKTHEIKDADAQPWVQMQSLWCPASGRPVATKGQQEHTVDAEKLHTIDTEIKAKRNNIITGLTTFRITKAKAKAKFRAKYLCGQECERSSVLININTKAKVKKYSRGTNFTLISESMVYNTIGRNHFSEIVPFSYLSLMMCLI